MDIKFRPWLCRSHFHQYLTEMVKGKTIAEAEKITNRAVAKALGGLPPQKMHCSNLAADALHKALDDYRQNRRQSAPQVV